MFKKIIALTLIFAMLVPFTAAAAADEPSESRSMEEILDEYHRRAFEAQAQGSTRAASAYSRSGGQTLEEETVDALTNAGYEAYNVTAGNYDTLEAQLQTDFAAMGLDPEGSYIIVIHGEPDTNGTNGNSRITDPPTEDDFGDGTGGTGIFDYTYNGVSYLMRYVTVTSTENSHLRVVDDVILNEELSADTVLEIVGMSSSIVGFLTDAVQVGGIATTVALINTPISISMLLLDLLPEYTPRMTDMIRMTGKCNWTVQYIQIYDSVEQEWFTNASVEYVTVQKYIDYETQNPDTHLLDNHRAHYDNEIIYSERYFDPETMKQRAVFAYEYGQGDNLYRDKVQRVEFKYGEDDITVLTLYRTVYDIID